MPHYKLTSPNGKSYHGITTLSVNRRMAGHKTAARNGSAYPLHAAIRKHGFENFILEVLSESKDLAELRTLEVAAIASDNTLSPAGYNLTAGGEGTTGHTVSDRHRKAIGERMVARWKDPVFAEMKRKNSSETATKLALSPEHKARLLAGSRAHWSDPRNVAIRTEKIQQLRKVEPERFATAIEKMRQGVVEYWSDPENRKAHAEKTSTSRSRQSDEKRKDVSQQGVAARKAKRLARERYLASLPPEQAAQLRAEAKAKRSAETSAGRARATPEQKEASRERYRQAALRRHAAKKASA